MTYKVIPDLAKAVRAELTAEPTRRAEARARRRRRTARRRRMAQPAAARRDTPRGAGDSAPAAHAGTRLPDVGRPRSPGPSSGSTARTRASGRRSCTTRSAAAAHKLTLKRRDLKVDRVEQVTVAPGHELKQHYELGDEYGE